MKKEVKRMISQTDPETIRRIQIAAARKAFHAYERALGAAQKALAHGPARGLGTAIMMKQYDEYPSYSWREAEEFKCSECEFIARGDLRGWKFCASCGAEIMRFERKPEYEPEEIKMKLVDGAQEPKPKEIKIKVVEVSQEPTPSAIQTEET
jgi:hypothetical protein